MNISSIDHIVLTVNNISETIQFYESVLGMTVECFRKDRVALKFGNQKINLHERGKEVEPKSGQPILGSEDLCFLISTDITEAMEHIGNRGIKILEGPVERTGATGKIFSFYFRDPDNNLIELANTIHDIK
jgi:catechol 2,3-dioxygenase-like lactoylglutathione lyase family enzyme